jgi:hypothetical protein
MPRSAKHARMTAAVASQRSSRGASAAPTALSPGFSTTWRAGGEGGGQFYMRK